jgi:hypothetical protein
MRTEGFTLHWRDGAGRIVGEPVIGWEKDHPVQPTMYFPISPSHPDTSSGDYYLSYEGPRGHRDARYWTISGGMITYYHAEEDAAISASGV